jgi:hypothetical protein
MLPHTVDDEDQWTVAIPGGFVGKDLDRRCCGPMSLDPVGACRIAEAKSASCE